MKIFAAVSRRPGISRAEFHDHWRHPHGTLGRHIAVLRGYVQSHQIDCQLLDERQHEFDGIGEAWVGGPGDLAAFATDPIYVGFLAADELRFVDRPRLRSLITEEQILTDEPPLTAQAAALPKAADDAADRLWTPHGSSTNVKILQLIEADGARAWASDDDLDWGRRLGALRHSRCTPVAGLNGPVPEFVGVRELWWPTRSAFERGVADAPSAWNALLSRPSRAVTLLAQAERQL